MHKCQHNLGKKEFCYTCVSEIRGHQGRMLDQLTNRLDYIWKNASLETKEIMIQAEVKYPLASTQVLASFPLENTTVKHYVDTVKTAAETLDQLKKIYPTAQLKYFDNSFIIYSDLETWSAVNGT